MIDDEERRKVKKRVTEGEIKRNGAVERKRKSRGSFTFFGGQWARVQRILCIYGQNLYGVVYRGTFIQGIR